MWTKTIRKKSARDGGRYASDMTDGEWAVIGSLLPAPKRLGHPRTTDLREVVNAILHSTRLVHAGFGLGTWTGGFPGTRKRISSMA